MSFSEIITECELFESGGRQCWLNVKDAWPSEAEPAWTRAWDFFVKNVLPHEMNIVNTDEWNDVLICIVGGRVSIAVSNRTFPRRFRTHGSVVVALLAVTSALNRTVFGGDVSSTSEYATRLRRETVASILTAAGRQGGIDALAGKSLSFASHVEDVFARYWFDSAGALAVTSG